MKIRNSHLFVLSTTFVLTLACNLSATSPQGDQAAFNTAVAQTAQVQIAQMTLQAQASPPTQIPPTIAQPTPPLTDEAVIKQALLAKLGWSEAELEFALSQNSGQHAQGSVKNVNETGGAAWFAERNNAGQWVIAYIGHGVPSCSEIQPYTFPAGWLSCSDASGNVIDPAASQSPPPAASADVYAPNPLGPAWSAMAFSKNTCYDLDVLFTASDATVDVCLDGNVVLMPRNGATFSGYAELSPPSLNTCKTKTLTADPIAPNSDLYMCFLTNLGKYGFFVMRDDQMLSSGYIVFDAHVFP